MRNISKSLILATLLLTLLSCTSGLGFKLASSIPKKADAILINSELGPDELYQEVYDTLIDDGFVLRVKDREEGVLETEFSKTIVNKTDSRRKYRFMFTIEAKADGSQATVKGLVLEDWRGPEYDIKLSWSGISFASWRVGFGKMVKYVHSRYDEDQIDYRIRKTWKF